MKGDGIGLPPDNYSPDGIGWGECEACQYFPAPVRHTTSSGGLKACISVRKTPFLRHFINIETIVLPSQARDKHRKELRATRSLQDQTEDPSAEDPTFYRSSVNLDAAWRAAGMRR